MENSENNRYKIISIALVIAIVATISFVIVPFFLPKTPEKIIEKIDFLNSSWIEQYMEGSVGLFGNDFYVNTAYSYNIRSNKLIATYASQNTVEEARNHYLSLTGAELTGRNDDTSLNVTAKLEGQDLRVYNFYSPISRVFELELTLDSNRAAQVISQLEEAYPEEEIANISGLDELISGEIFGGYVRYQYDTLDSYALPYIPIFSRAYLFDGTEEEVESIIISLNELYPDYRYDDTQTAHHYRIDGKLVSISYFVTDLDESIVSIGIQDQRD